MKVLVATDKPFAKVAVDGIRKEIEAAGYELVLLEKYGEKAKLLEAVKDANAIIIRSDIIDAEVLDAAKELKIVVRAGAGYDNVDLEAATAHNVCVMNTPGQNSNAVAELAFGLMVMAVRNMYNGTSGTELMGKKLGIHAYGNVGRNVARIAKGFGMEIYAFDAFCPKEVIEKDGVKAVGSAEELYSTCDVVSLHIPATAETKNSINYALVNKMPKGGLLVNTARKEVINEAELIQLMEERTDLKYMTDIMPAANETFAAKFAGRYFSTPKKMGAQTAEANINAAAVALTKGETAKARRYLERFATMPIAYNNMGILCLQEGKRDKAEVYLTMAAAAGIEQADRVLKELKNKYKKFEAFNEKFEIDDNFLAEIRTLADKEKIKFDEKQYNQSLPLIKTQLKALIARDLWDMNEYFQVMNSTNQSVQQALKVLNEGIYSTIIQ